MFVRNLLQAGEFVTTVPVGLPVTLQYNEKGVIQKIFYNHDKNVRVDMSDELLPNALKKNLVPHKITVRGGTTWIYGVFYTSNIYPDGGKLPECVKDTLVRYYQTNPTHFKFYAGNVESLAATFRGAVAIRQWLTVSRFSLLPGYVVPAGLTETMFENMVKRNYPFVYPLISSYIVFHKTGTISYPSTNLRQATVTSVTESFNEYGDLFADITTSEGVAFPQLHVLYPTVVHFNIDVGALIVVNSYGVVYANSLDPALLRSRRPSTIVCKCCGRQLIVPDPTVRSFRCTDPQCSSVLYPRIRQMLTELSLPLITHEQYMRIIESNKAGFALLDIFESPQYKDAKIEVTLVQAVRAIIPKEILPSDIQIAQLCDAVNNSREALMYYIQNVDKMKIDLDLDFNAFCRLFRWLSDFININDTVEFLRLPFLHYVSPSVKFPGPPIFRDKLILITGTFVHGSLSEIEAILRSYAADVTTEFSTQVSCVLVGDIQENINGHAMISAQKHRIPIMAESQFFAEYDIDSDITENL